MDQVFLTVECGQASLKPLFQANSDRAATMRLALYQPDIPQNVGAAIRIAAGFGAGLDIIEPCGFPLGEKSLRRAAMDYATLVHPSIHKDFASFHRQVRKRRLVLLTTSASQSLWKFEFRRDDIILLGRESAGVPPEVHETANARLVIPLEAGARSLNVAVSGAIVLAEAQRQKIASGLRS